MGDTYDKYEENAPEEKYPWGQMSIVDQMKLLCSIERDPRFKEKLQKLLGIYGQ